MAPPLNLIVVADTQIHRVRSAWPELRAFLENRQVTISVVDDGCGTVLADCQAELAVVLGGDGAILRACRQMGVRQMPVLGVNLGRLGFLADLSPGEFRRQFHEIEQRNYSVGRYLMFECTLTRTDGTTESHLGLNEAAVSSGGALRMIDMHLAIDGEPVAAYSGDGLILSTPIGSTAHSLSAGGPILGQDLQAFVITPICPHTLTNRPLVDHADRLYTVTLPAIPVGVTLVIDGQVRLPLAAGDRIDVRKAAVSFLMAKIPQCRYYATLHRKLNWGGQPNYHTD